MNTTRETTRVPRPRERESVYRALLSVCRSLLSEYRALLSVCRALLSVYRALLSVVWEFESNLAHRWFLIRR